MNQVSYHTDKEILYIDLSGRIDTTNAAQVEEAVGQAVSAEPEKRVVLDVQQLEYISSAGLRVILKLLKKKKDLSIINASAEVYDILDMTGFTDMLSVKKAFRRLSVEGCEIIGRGANGAVYRYDPETIIKVYHNPDALPEIEAEREICRKAFVLGVNTAIPYDVVRVGNGYGTVMELLAATSISKMIRADPEHLEEPVKYYVDTIRHIHGIHLKPGTLPDMKALAMKWAQFDVDHLPEDQGRKLCALVAAVPERDTMMHGDYHTNNIMVRDGETLLIDMDTLCMGHPIFELGSMFNAFVGFNETNREGGDSFLGFSNQVAGKFWRMSLARYLDTEEEAVINAVEEKARIVGYMRLLRRAVRRPNEADSADMIAHCKRMLAELLAKVDTLDF